MARLLHRSAPAITARVAVLLMAALVATGAGAAASARADCAAVSPVYPGDAAAKPDIAAWMAGGAARAGLPGALPVMAALVESDLTNLPGGDADSVGYFQMRFGIWNSGKYTGYATNPALQLQWFIDEASPIAYGRAADETKWGEWIADTERPAAQYRGRYQLRLAEAKALIAPGCGTTTPVAPTTETHLLVTRTTPQNVMKVHALRFTATCPDEACSVKARVRVTGSGLRRPVSSSAGTKKLAIGQKVNVRVPFDAALRRAARTAYTRGHPLKAALTVTATDAEGNPGVVTTTVRLSARR